MPYSIHIKLKRSFYLSILMAILHLAIAIWLIFSSLPALLTIMGCLCIGVSYLWGFNKAWQPSYLVNALSYHHGRWQIKVNNQYVAVQLIRPIFLCPWLIIIFCQTSQKKRYGILVTNDMLSSYYNSLLRILVQLELSSDSY